MPSATPPILLGVNIDHVATLRQARGTRYPDPLHAAYEAEAAGADGITVHLREDRRHIQDRDIRLLAETLQTPMNLEMADTDEMRRIALEIIPRHCCLVPERRAELTTEGGLDVPAHLSRLTETCHMLESAGIAVSLFIDPEPEQVTAAAQCGASTIEIHTGRYADAPPHEAARELQRVAAAAALGRDAGLIVNAGHGLHCHNVGPIAALTAINELNIGHAIIARAVFVGLRDAVREIKAVMLTARAASAG